MHLEKGALAGGSSDMNYNLSLAIVAVACPRLLGNRVCWEYGLWQLKSVSYLQRWRTTLATCLAKSSVRAKSKYSSVASPRFRSDRALQTSGFSACALFHRQRRRGKARGDIIHREGHTSHYSLVNHVRRDIFQGGWQYSPRQRFNINEASRSKPYTIIYTLLFNFMTLCM